MPAQIKYASLSCHLNATSSLQNNYGNFYTLYPQLPEYTSTRWQEGLCEGGRLKNENTLLWSEEMQEAEHNAKSRLSEGHLLVFCILSVILEHV